MIVKADSQVNKAVWVNAFEAQIEVLASKVESAARAVSAEEDALTLEVGREGEAT